MKAPSCYVIGGSNGAGKTTFATEFLPVYAKCPNFINPDVIARAFSALEPDAALIRTGRLVLNRIAEFASARADFAFESTLSGRAYVPLLRGLKREGYDIHLFYVWIPAPELALLRIRDRVEGGGHNVPERDVRRRFDRTLRNFFTLYRPLCTSVHFFDNSSDVPRLIFKEEAGQLTLLDASVYEHLRRSYEP